MEDYKKKYEDALDNFKKIKNANNDNKELIDFIEFNYPELKKSEDEVIRQEIMDFIDTKTIDSDERRNRWFSYLEKHKPVSITSLEDTKIKMSLIQYISELNQDIVHLHPGIETCNEWIAWLEKSKYTEEDLDNTYKCADEVQYRRGYENAKKEIEKQGEQKPVWSEEDEKMWSTISDLLWEGYKLSDKKVSWNKIRCWLLPKIKSLKERIKT